MVEFVTLFLGLAFGSVDVELAVGDEVAAVVLELDGERLVEISGPPWETALDLGAKLRPHRLEALALDTQGREIDRATQYLNLHRPPAEVGFVVHRNSAGWTTMVGLTWESRISAVPRHVAVSLDGRQLEVEDPTRIWVPPLDPRELHILDAVVEFSDRVVVRDQIGIGGLYLDETSARLTAVAAKVADPQYLPSPEATRVVVADSERVPRVVAVERGESEIVFVRDEAAASGIKRLITTGATVGALSGAKDALAARVIKSIPLLDDERVRIVYPMSFRRAGRRLDHELLPITQAIDSGTGGCLYWHLTSAPDVEKTASSRLSDAVAIAGSRAAAGNGRRAVVLILAPGSEDQGSRLTPSLVEDYFEALGVPLHVWYLGKAAKSPPEWGPARSVRTLKALERELNVVRESLEYQRIVWVDGLYLPDEVRVDFESQAGGVSGASGR